MCDQINWNGYIYYLIELYCDIWRIILTLSNHPGRWFVVVFPKHLARQVRWMNSGLSNRGMILRNFRANQFNLKLISISLVGNTIAFHVVCLHFFTFHNIRSIACCSTRIPTQGLVTAHAFYIAINTTATWIT